MQSLNPGASVAACIALCNDDGSMHTLQRLQRVHAFIRHHIMRSGHGRPPRCKACAALLALGAPPAEHEEASRDMRPCWAATDRLDAGHELRKSRVGWLNLPVARSVSWALCHTIDKRVSPLPSSFGHVGGGASHACAGRCVSASSVVARDGIL